MAITAWGLQTGWIAVGLISLVLMAPLGTALIEPRRRTIARQCLSRRIGSQEELEREVQAWQQSRNQAFLVNYGDRYHNGFTISTAFVESTVNEVIGERFVKKQQMRWTKEGAHRLLQVRVQVLNDELRQAFCRWYPGMLETQENTEEKAAA